MVAAWAVMACLHCTRRLNPSWIEIPQVHVRHGDKKTEEDLVGDHTYWEKAQVLQAAPENGLAKSMFLSTYDPATVAFFENVTRHAGWAPFPVAPLCAAPGRTGSSAGCSIAHSSPVVHFCWII